MREVVPIRHWMLETASYLVKGDRPYLVDTHSATIVKMLPTILNILASNGVKTEDLTYILITHFHFDHVGNLAKLKALSNARVVAGRMDVPFIEGRIPLPRPRGIDAVGKIFSLMPSWLWQFEKATVDVALEEGDRIDELGLDVLSLPGHTPGGTGLVDMEAKRAFIGDIVFNMEGKIGWPFLSMSESLGDLRKSVERLASLDLNYVYPGHGPVIGPNASQLLREFLENDSNTCAS